MPSENLKLFTDIDNKNKGPVVCLGIEFENDVVRREHFTDLLREKLKNPEFRNIEGFPLGEDEDILALSDPPYYTACPNPWIGDFISEWETQKPEKPEDYKYHREPFAADVSEGKNDPIYNAHSYHTKVPHKAIMRYILHYTEPGDIVFDGFCGTGMTGVAAQMCGDKAIIESLGVTKLSPEQKYKVEKDGTILEKQINEEGKYIWVPFSRLGARKAVLKDLSPAATFIAYNYNTPVDIHAFEYESKRILEEVEKECGWMYETKHSNDRVGRIDYTVWSEVFSCPECAGEIVFLNEALDLKTKQVRDTFPCPHCRAVLSKKVLERCEETNFDKSINRLVKRTRREPCLIVYSIGKKRFEKKPDQFDLDVLKKIDAEDLTYFFPTDRMMHAPDDKDAWGDKWRAGTASFTHVHHLFLPRAKKTLTFLWDGLSTIKDKNTRSFVRFCFEQSIMGMSLIARYVPSHFSQVNQYMTGVYYVASQHAECSPWYILNGKTNRLIKAFGAKTAHLKNLAGTGDASKLLIEDCSLDYIFVDPPFGDNLAYGELNFVLEAFHKVFTNMSAEAIVSKHQNKEVGTYHQLMRACFLEFHRILKPGGWMTVEFSNTKANIWNSIQNAIADSGIIIANVSALDKKQGSFNAVTNTTSVKQDLVISAYKPNGGFEERFANEAQSEEGVWDFIRTHLKYLPVIKKQGLNIVNIPERDPRILYDQVVAYYVRKGYPVPISSQDFQLGLAHRFSERDGMNFLPEQVAEYDRKKMIGGGRPIDRLLFISDEASAIEWLRILLRDKPQSFQDLNPQFMKEISGWSKNEKPLELSTLLDQNFLCYDGKNKVPDQIHSYLSTNWKDMRNLEKDDPILIAKAKVRWYVPDPNKAGDLEKLREKSLLKEFEEYKAAKKKIKIFRLEAVRAGFKKCWQERDYVTIINVAEKIPNKILEEDPKLLMWYDQAVTRMGGE